jgi:fumarate reductase iron-sulfur subunit
MISITITRGTNENQLKENFKVGASKITTLLSALYEIKSTVDASLCYDSGCRCGVCGSCAVLVDGKEELACSYKVKDGDNIEPLKNQTILRDLKVQKSHSHKTLIPILKSIDMLSGHMLTLNPKHSKQTDCILCNSCYSACPVYAVNPDFLGPFALTRAYRYSEDKREGDAKAIIDNIQTNGVWDCTLCGECTAVCPKGIDPKMDITMLRGTSLQFGYSDPSFATQSFGTPDFGFDPNGGF